ncbi:hypothetical protein PHYPSEUDO_008737 [Phytophthora pseudosyringae]|uniref:RxLR effector protein n=1 Tax=Phytophthora pseudosyringae TaxID=221518 RepID=A0A8T1VEF9_9STRA|nr:hypothetical protein PHYPSEUDO_008737 [Phytophthora pseudosyringae]
MKRCYILAALAAAFLAIGEAAMPTGFTNNHQLTSDSNQRFLRATETIGGDAAAEERGIPSRLAGLVVKLQGATKLQLPKKMQFKVWLKAEWDPKQLSAHFGFAGKDKALVQNDPNYLVLLEYGKLWRKNALNGGLIRT